MYLSKALDDNLTVLSGSREVIRHGKRCGAYVL